MVICVCMVSTAYTLDNVAGLDCYVCMEPCLTLSPCNCTNLYLHEHCYATLIKYNNYACTVCKQTYPDLHINLEEGTMEDSGDDEEEDDADERNPFWCTLLLPMQCRRIQNKYTNPYDIFLDYARHFVATWCFTALINSFGANVLGIYDNQRPFMDVFSVIDIGTWMFSVLLYCFFLILLQNVVRQ